MKRRTLLGALGALMMIPFAGLRKASARPANFMNYEQLHSKSDLIVIAYPAKQRIVGQAFNFFNVDAIGVETTFVAVATFKDKRKEYGDSFVLYHYQMVDPAQPIVDGPMFLSLDLKNKAQYLLFLQNEDNELFKPTTGQMDADFSVEKLRFPAT